MVLTVSHPNVNLISCSGSPNQEVRLRLLLPPDISRQNCHPPTSRKSNLTMAEANNSPRLSSKSWIEDISGDNAALSLLVSAINEILAEEIINMTPEEVAAGMHLRLFSQEPPMQVKPQSPFEAYHALMSGTIANIFDDLMFVPDFTRESQVRLKFDFLMSTVNDIETPEDLNTAKHFLKSK